MKAKNLLIACLIASHSIVTVKAQGTFENLGFESASPIAIAGDPYGRVQFDSAFPGWVGYIGGVQQTAALFNSVYLDSSGISIIDNGWPSYLGPTAGVIEGGFTAILQAGVAGPFGTPADTTLSQTSLVPVGAQSLRFRSYSSPSFGSVSVLLGGQLLPLIPQSTGINYTLFAADIHTWQGQTAQLDFTVLAPGAPGQIINIFLDSIVFSPEAIPEPTASCLFGLGALFLGGRLWCKRT